MAVTPAGRRPATNGRTHRKTQRSSAMSTLGKSLRLAAAIAMTLALAASDAHISVATPHAPALAAGYGPMPNIIDLQHGIPAARPKSA